jgi:Flp pilus assembly protein TadG
VQVLIILVPVLFGFIGFAVDLGRLYLARAEITTAANAMALAAAAHLIGTDQSIADANTAARIPIADDYGNRYDFGRITVGVGDARLASAAPEPVYFETASGATGEAGSSDAGSTAARYVRVDIAADAPLTFWGLLSVAQDRKTQVAARAVAGISAPLCTACGVEPVAVAALNVDDPVNFGFTVDDRYTLRHLCQGAQQPPQLANTVGSIPYMLVNRYNQEATLFSDEMTQAYRIGAGGLPGSTTPALSCLTINTSEAVWTSATPAACVAGAPQAVRAFTCGLASRFDAALPVACEQIAEAGTVIGAYQPDTDVSDVSTWPAYTGNTRRVITVAIVEALDTASMNVIGFRQFLLQPTIEDGAFTGADNNGRFIASYLGSPVPLRGGGFAGCSIESGPGKVVLHR